MSSCRRIENILQVVHMKSTEKISSNLSLQNWAISLTWFSIFYLSAPSTFFKAFYIRSRMVSTCRCSSAANIEIVDSCCCPSIIFSIEGGKAFVSCGWTLFLSVSVTVMIVPKKRISFSSFSIRFYTYPVLPLWSFSISSSSNASWSLFTLSVRIAKMGL